MGKIVLLAAAALVAECVVNTRAVVPPAATTAGDGCDDLIDLSGALDDIEAIVSDLGVDIAVDSSTTFCSLYELALEEVDALLDTLAVYVELEAYGLQKIDLQGSCNKTFMDIYGSFFDIANNTNVGTYWAYIRPDPSVEYSTFLTVSTDLGVTLETTLEAEGMASTTFGDACPSQCKPECVPTTTLAVLTTVGASTTQAAQSTSRQATQATSSSSTTNTEELDPRCEEPVVDMGSIRSALLEDLFASAFGAAGEEDDFCASFTAVVGNIDTFVEEDLSLASDCSNSFEDLVSLVEAGLGGVTNETFEILAAVVGTDLGKDAAVAELSLALDAVEVWSPHSGCLRVEEVWLDPPPEHGVIMWLRLVALFFLLC